MRLPTRILSVAFVALAVAVAPAAGAFAADPLDPILQYTGTASVSSADGVTDGYPLSATVDCTTLPCMMTVAVTDNSVGASAQLTGATPLAVSGPSGSFDVVDSGTPCDLTYIGSGPFSYSATETGLTVTREVFGSGQVDCPDGSTVEYIPGTLTGTLSLTSGSVCLLLGDCPTPTPTPAPVATNDGVALPISSDGPITASTPSTLSTLPTVAQALRPANVVWATALTVVLVILVALPSQLFNNAVEAGSDRISAWWKQRRGTAVPSSAAPAKPWAGWPLAAGGVLAASLISSFVDPSFGLNAQSPRVFLSILVSFILDAVAGWFLVIWLVRRSTPEATAQFRFVPATLLIVLGAVLFSRFTGFQPGIVFGLVAGVVFGSVVAASQRGRIAVVSLGYSFVVGVIAWMLYSLASSAGGDVALFAQETLSAIAIAGIAALPIALIPLRGLAGYEIFAWNKVIWGIAYALGLFGFFFVLMPMPFAWEGVPLEAGVWVGLYLLYAVVAVGAWLLIVRPWEKKGEALDG